MEDVGDVVAGGLGGLACVLAGQPLDTIKVKLQTYPHLYSSSLDAIRKTLRQERFAGFYAGASPAVLSSVLENAVLFVCYSHCQQLVQLAVGAETQDGMSVVQQASSGALASVFSSVAITPPDRIKCKLQVYQQQNRETVIKRSTMNVARQIIREEGATGLFRGLTSTWAREVPGYFFFFGGYNASRRLLTPPGRSSSELSAWRLALAGGIAGCCFWTSIYPTDLVKSRIQVQGDLSGSFWVTFYQILRNEGVLALYSGLVPTVVRCFPACGALFVTYEYTKRLLVPQTTTLDTDTT